MPVPSADFKQALKKLSEKEKEALVLRLVRKDAEAYDALAFELLEDVTLETLFDRSTTTIHDIMFSVSGRSLSKALSRGLKKATQEIARYQRITKDRKGEVELHLYLLHLLFENFTGQFESIYKGFYVATARLVLRTMMLIKKHLHEDYHLEYQDQLNTFLTDLNGRSKRRQLPFNLPMQFEVE
ncbi:hypothetical protein ACD591_15375 [Rufibacter glacialis]|uniref:Uncharacterized protein n=1 Tax=Rufibacter glacialis TaxID=1259555 RepID=A0A5M8QN71_9BACT|nr:hypothetical protein [Rufibacter glacialis]KAA6437667.1 hypothetical protein FOE74_03965 [Rufibacter glacialis]GGK57363.1 hypothetical protein GCM10011405_01830 [Rufibacter glacialis]